MVFGVETDGRLIARRCLLLAVSRFEGVEGLLETLGVKRRIRHHFLRNLHVFEWFHGVALKGEQRELRGGRRFVGIPVAGIRKIPNVRCRVTQRGAGISG